MGRRLAVVIANNYGDQVTNKELSGYKELAAAVFLRAFEDVNQDWTGTAEKREKQRVEKSAAAAWLTSEESADEREFWLVWLGLNDHEFQRMLRSRKFGIYTEDGASREKFRFVSAKNKVLEGIDDALSKA